MELSGGKSESSALTESKRLSPRARKERDLNMRGDLNYHSVELDFIATTPEQLRCTEKNADLGLRLYSHNTKRKSDDTIGVTLPQKTLPRTIIRLYAYYLQSLIAVEVPGRDCPWHSGDRSRMRSGNVDLGR